MIRGVRCDARIFCEGKRGGHSVTPTSEALDRLDLDTEIVSPSEALDRLDLDTVIESPSDALDRHHDITPEALDRLRSRDSLRAAPFGRRACFVVLPVPGLALRVHQDSTATAPRSSPADSFGARGAPASLVPRTVPAGGRLGGPRRPPASARHAYCHVLRCNSVQTSSWWNERARPGRGEAESLSRHYPNEVRVSCSATASGPRAFGAVGGVVALSACAGGAWAFGSRYCRCGAGSVYP